MFFLRESHCSHVFTRLCATAKENDCFYLCELLRACHCLARSSKFWHVNNLMMGELEVYVCS